MAFPFALPLLLDGAMGTSLRAKGLPAGACTEEWAAQHPQAVAELYRAYLAAGSGAVYTPTFCANPISLARYGLEAKTRELNLTLAATTRAAVGPDILLGGDMAPTGEACAPFGEGRFLEHISAYAEQALALRDGGVDFLAAETMTSLSEARAALMGAWQARLPVFVTLTVNESGRADSGADPLAAMIALQAMGAAAFGLNCCAPEVLAQQLERLAPYARLPLIAKPSAGLPNPETGAYPLSPRDFSQRTHRLLGAGARILGGCCGTTPEHIAAMGQALREFDWSTAPARWEQDGILVCSGTDVFFLDEDFELSEPLACTLGMEDELLAAADAGCDVISIHVGSNEDAFCFSQNAHMARLPVSFLAENEEALEEALIYYNGRALVDSRSEVERARLEELCAGYGAVLR